MELIGYGEWLELLQQVIITTFGVTNLLKNSNFYVRNIILLNYFIACPFFLLCHDKKNLALLQTETAILYHAVIDFFALSLKSNSNPLLNTDNRKKWEPYCKEWITVLVVKER